MVGYQDARPAPRRLLRSCAVAVLLLGSLVPAAAAGTAVVTCEGHRATVVGTTGDDSLVGTPGVDVIAGLSGDDRIDGRGGDDRIRGGFSADSLRGGPGRDRLFGGMDRVAVDEEGTAKTGDQLRGGSGADRLVPGRDKRPADDTNPDAILWDTSSRPVVVDVTSRMATGDGKDSFVPAGAWLVGSPFGDTFRGGPAADLLSGGHGRDEIRAAGGDDRVRADSGQGRGAADLVWGGPGSDELSSHGGHDVVHGGPGDDVIDDSGRSADVLTGDRGDDLLIGQIVRSDLSQVYAGGPGRDQLALLSNLMNPLAEPSAGSWDMATGEMVLDFQGAQQLRSSGFEEANLSTFGASWTVLGTEGADEVSVGSMRASVFYGLGGDDRFLASAYDDTFDGGSGTDESLGMGEGNDTCVSVEILAVDGCETVTP